SKNDYFKGEFISNDIASVYPRRDALVKDILVDIGDEVKAGETLALLFNPGVGGEGQSKINLKDTVVSSKNNLLEEVKNVKEAKIAELDQKIAEREIILQETIKNFDSKILQIGDNDTLGSEYQVQLKGLENLQKNLENAITSKEQLLEESKNNITQKDQLLHSKIDEIYNNIIPILYVGSENELDYNSINSYDFSNQFGAKDTNSKKELISIMKSFHDTYAVLGSDEKYKKLIEINNLLVKVLHNTIISIHADENIIQSHISNINTYNISLISQKEMLDDAKNMYKILEVSQKEKIENIEIQILKKENEIALLSTKSESTEAEKSLAASKISAGIETLKKSRDLLIANEDKAIISLENEIRIAKADLNNEYIKSGDYKIVSPFSGIISKRGIKIGEKISPNMETFRLVGVDTSLSKITKKEVKFYVPENIKENLEIGKEIFFSLGDNAESSFTGSIYRISPEIDEKTFTITVQAKVNENITLPNKSTLRVHLETKEEIFKIPSSSVYNKEERKIVYYKKDNGKLGVADVNIVSDDGEYSLVTGNFDDTLKVVTTPIFIK
ncbi:MAG: HlyD family efflux transporter periplasmic adaptor subunit, partial [Candidatus Gracilibacteria bacterium]|nr:HlyD family efflux transporter periplasmic adaptor subunit [Candidatus Gracilibacteria bacterium]